eukprot:4969204-Pyramimonas_sp.AAC.1
MVKLLEWERKPRPDTDCLRRAQEHAAGMRLRDETRLRVRLALGYPGFGQQQVPRRALRHR